MYKCLIVDDEELARNLIQNHLNQLDDFEVVACCESAIEANKVLKAQKVDLLFLDIEMPVLRGTEFLKNLIHKPKVIFTTAYREYAIEGFDLNAIDYLLKPISFSRFFKAIEKFVSQQERLEASMNDSKTPFAPKERFMFVREDRKQVKITFDDILYIESLRDYVKIHLQDKSHLTKNSITAFETLLDERFLRIHRSFIVNIHKITAYTKHDIEINQIEIPIGERYKSAVSDRLSR